jgi:arylsulfatase A
MGQPPTAITSCLPMLGKNDDTPEREVLIHNTYATKWAVRQGDWLYMDTNSGGHQVMPEFFTELRGYADFETERLLFNLKDDPDQRINLFDQYPEKVIEMERLITDSKEKGYLIKD